VRALWWWISVQMYRRACAENEEVSDLYKVARQYKETWMLFLESTFSLILCTFHQFNRNFSESAKFSWNMCVCVCVCVCARARAFYPVPWSCFQVEYKLAQCYHFKYFHLEIWKKVWFSVIIPYVIYCIFICLSFGDLKAMPAA